MKQEDLKKTIFPVGTFEKPLVRELATKYGLAIANKPDSQEICFVQAKSYKDFIEQEVPKELLRPGKIIDVSGKVRGEHTGLHAYTIGQRKGLGVNSIEPLYVLGLYYKTNELIVGPESHLFRKRATVAHMHWINKPIDHPTALHAKIRYRAKESPVYVTPLKDRRIEVAFEVPQRAITPGQALVLYEGDRVVGGGWIEDLPIDFVNTVSHADSL